MSNQARFPGGARFEGTITLGNVTVQPGWTRANQQQEQLAVFPIPWTWWRVHDALQTNLPGTAASDDLALIGGTFGTGVPTIQTGDLKAAGATTRYARCTIPMPVEYDSAADVVLRFHAGMETTVSDTTATLDVEAYLSDKEAAVDGADLYTGASQTINSLTYTDVDFALTSSALEAGDLLDVRIAIAVNDGATGTAVIGSIGAAYLLCDIRG